MKSFLSFVLIFLLLIPLAGCAATRNELTVDILDIGKADCSILRYGDKVCIIDAGEEENLPNILAILQTKRIQKIDALIISHFDKDHVGGAAGLVERYDIGSVYLSAFEKDNEATENFLRALKEKDIEPVRLTENFSFSFDDLHFLLSPPKQSSYAKKEDNNATLAVTAELGEKRLFFGGDAMEERIGELLQEGLGDMDFMKLPYHGNALNNLDQLLDQTKPEISVITCSKKNPPDPTTLLLLEERNISFFLTENGDIHLSVTANSLKATQS